MANISPSTYYAAAIFAAVLVFHALVENSLHFDNDAEPSSTMGAFFMMCYLVLLIVAVPFFLSYLFQFADKSPGHFALTLTAMLGVVVYSLGALNEYHPLAAFDRYAWRLTFVSGLFGASTVCLLVRAMFKLSDGRPEATPSSAVAPSAARAN